MSNTFHYFAFGSNLLNQRITLSNKSAKFIGIGKLSKHRLDFVGNSNRWKGGVATIVEDDKNDVLGCIWEMSKDDSDSLDRQEGYDQNPRIYGRKEVEIEKLDNNSRIRCRTYYNLAWSDDYKKPSLAYLKIIREGAKENNFPVFYQTFLNSIVWGY